MCMFMSQITGSVWYLLAIERNDRCWRDACMKVEACQKQFLYCGNSNKRIPGYYDWRNISQTVLKSSCSVENDNPPFNYGIFTQAIESNIVASIDFFPKFCYCLWWGLQNLRYISLILQGLNY